MTNIWDILSMLGSLALIGVVLFLTYYASRWYARRAGASGSGKYIKVLDKAAVGTGASLLAVQVGEKYYLIGAAEKSVNLICELDGQDLPPEEAPAQAASFSRMFGDAVQKALHKKKDGGDEQ